MPHIEMKTLTYKTPSIYLSAKHRARGRGGRGDEKVKVRWERGRERLALTERPWGGCGRATT